MYLATTHARRSPLARAVLVVFVGAVGLAVVPDLAPAPALAAEVVPGEIIVADHSAAGGTGALLRITLSSAAQSTVSTGGFFDAPFGVTADRAGNLLVADPSAFNGNGGVIKVHPTTGDQSAVTSERSFINPTGLVVDANGDILVVDADALGGLGAVIRVDPRTNVQTTVSPASTAGYFGNPSGIALEADGKILVVDPDALNGDGAVLRVDPQSGQQTVVAFGGTFGNPSGIAVESSGMILVVDPDLLDGDGGVVRIHPGTGVQTVVASGGTFGNPTGIALLPNGYILVADPDAFGGNGGIIGVSPFSTRSTDIRTTIASGGSFRDPVGIVPAPVPPTPDQVPSGPYAPVTFTPPSLQSPSCTSSLYTVPRGVTRLGFEVVGDTGNAGLDGSPLSGTHSGGSGGFGGMAFGELGVTPDQVIFANVGYNFTGGQGIGGGGFGGEMSFLTSDPGALTATGMPSPLAGGGCDVSSFLVVAAGGGGGGGAEATFGGTGGNGGGLIGDNGRSGGSGDTSVNNPGRGGAGGTQVAGGSGGPGSGLGEGGRSGTAQVGGRGGNSSPGSCDLPVGCDQGSTYGDGGGGGGGGGLYGAGGGGVGTTAGGGGGGGGSSYLHPQQVSYPLTVPTRTRATRPSITLTPLDVATVTIVTASPDPAGAGQPVTLTATVSPAPSLGPLPRGAASVTFAVDGTTVGTTSVESATGVATSPALTQLSPGTHSVEARYAGNGFLLASTGTGSVAVLQPDTTPPTVTVAQAAGQADPTNGSPVRFTVTFSEPVTGFAAADVSLATSTAGGTLAATVTGGPAVYTVAVAGMTSPGTVVATVGAGAALDGAGNPSAAATSTDNTVTFDATGPTVAIGQAAGQADPTNGSPVRFTVTFTEPVTGFVTADVSLAASTAGGTLAATVTGGPAVYTVAVAGMTSPGTVVATVGAGAALDGAGNPSAAATSTDNTVAFDATGPTVACSASPAIVRGNNHKLAAISVTVTASDGGSAAPFVLVSVTSNQADSGAGRGDVAGDIQGWTAGIPDTAGQVRIERYLTDRVYTMTYRATDAAGNTATCAATVAIVRG